MTSEENSSHSSNIPLKQAHEIGWALVELQEQIRKLTQEVAQVRDPLHKTISNKAMMLALLTSNNLPPIKALIMRNED